MIALGDGHYMADEGYVFRKKSNLEVMGNELFLGLSYYDDNMNLLPEPHADVIEDYEEIMEVKNDIRHGEDVEEF